MTGSSTIQETNQQYRNEREIIMLMLIMLLSFVAVLIASIKLTADIKKDWDIKNIMDDARAEKWLRF